MFEALSISGVWFQLDKDFGTPEGTVLPTSSTVRFLFSYAIGSGDYAAPQDRSACWSG